METSSKFSYDSSEETDIEEKNVYLTEESIIFLIDGDEKIFENNIFTKCLELYRNIVRQKCSDNSKDKLGLILYGTEKTNCDIDNVMILQKYETVTVDSLKNILTIFKNGTDEYKEMISTSKCSLYNILAYAFQLLHASKTNIKTRNMILLCTCNDNPCSNDAVEKRRVESLLLTFKDNQTEFHVIGFSDDWNDEIFYKDLQVISGTFSDDDYRRMYLTDFEDNILNAARSLYRLPWKFGDFWVDVTIYNLTSTPKVLKKDKLDKDENVLLETHHIMREETPDDSQLESTDVDDLEKDTTIVTDPEEEIMYSLTYCGEIINFTSSEYKHIKNLGFEPCIEILIFIPIVCDPLYHVDSAYFVTYNDDCNYEKKDFFKALIVKCTSKKLMPVCKVITRHAVLICQMIPGEDEGGFYMYKMPFADMVRDPDDNLNEYQFDESENECPINSEAVEVFKQLMDHSKIEFDKKLFKDPKLEEQLAHIEALALDEELDSLPPDNTLPPPVSDEAKDLENKLIDLLKLNENIEVEAKKRVILEDDSESTQILQKKQKLEDIDIQNIAKDEKLHLLTTLTLKEFLKKFSLSTAGNKALLVDRLYEYYKSNGFLN